MWCDLCSSSWPALFVAFFLPRPARLAGCQAPEDGLQGGLRLEGQSPWPLVAWLSVAWLGLAWLAINRSIDRWMTIFVSFNLFQSVSICFNLFLYLCSFVVALTLNRNAKERANDLCELQTDSSEFEAICFSRRRSADEIFRGPCARTSQRSPRNNRAPAWAYFGLLELIEPQLRFLDFCKFRANCICAF